MQFAYACRLPDGDQQVSTLLFPCGVTVLCVQGLSCLSYLVGILGKHSLTMMDNLAQNPQGLPKPQSEVPSNLLLSVLITTPCHGTLKKCSVQYQC